jgi:hypothetical protein
MPAEVLKVSNKIEDVRAVLIGLKIQYGERMSFVSYIDGEYGCRVMLYHSVVRDFAAKQHARNNVVISLVFKGLTFYVQEYSDIIIEIQSPFFEGTPDSEEVGIDNSQTSWNHCEQIVPHTKYTGSDGWNLNYIRGVHDDRYEEIIKELELQNIIYTTHYDGSRRFNVHNNANYHETFLYGKIYDTNIVGNGEDILTLCQPNIEKTTQKNDNICLWIRNTNKHPYRNIPPEMYNRLFQYCIEQKKHLYVFQDLVAVPLPESEYVHECQHIKEDNIPMMDQFLDICKTCYIFVGATSGIADIVSVYSAVNIVLTGPPEAYMKANGATTFANNADELIQHIEHLYTLE